MNGYKLVSLSMLVTLMRAVRPQSSSDVMATLFLRLLGITEITNSHKLLDYEILIIIKVVYCIFRTIYCYMLSIQNTKTACEVPFSFKASCNRFPIFSSARRLQICLLKSISVGHSSQLLAEPDIIIPPARASMLPQELDHNLGICYQLFCFLMLSHNGRKQ